MSGEQEEIVDVDDLVRKMITSEMPAFAKDFIEEKFKQVIEGFKQESSIDASESKSAKFQEEMKEVQKEIENIQDDILAEKAIRKESDEMSKKTAQIRSNLFERLTLMTTYIDSQIQTKTEHSMKAINSITRKIVELKIKEKKIDQNHSQEIDEVKEELLKATDEIVRLLAKKEEMQNQLNEIDGQLDVEKNQLQMTDKAKMEIEELVMQSNDLEKQLSQLILVANSEQEDLERMANAAGDIQKETNEVIEQIQTMASGNDEMQGMANDSETLQRELTNLMDMIKKSTDCAELESDNLFQREVIYEDYYRKEVEKLAVMLDDNSHINEDYTRNNDVLKKIEQTVDQLQNEIKLVDAELDAFNNEMSKIEVEGAEIELKLQSSVAAAKEAEELYTKEIQELNEAFAKEERKFDELQSQLMLTSAHNSMKLEQEKSWTRRAHKRQKAVPVESKSFAKRDSSPSQPENKTFTRQSTKGTWSGVADQQSASNSSLESRSSFDNDMMERKKKIRASLQKADELPVYLGSEQEQKQKTLKTEVEDEKAFDSDDTSFNITFNTDIEDFIG